MSLETAEKTICGIEFMNIIKRGQVEKMKCTPNVE
jgi:hypothetical protein